MEQFHPCLCNYRLVQGEGRGGDGVTQSVLVAAYDILIEADTSDLVISVQMSLSSAAFLLPHIMIISS